MMNIVVGFAVFFFGAGLTSLHIFQKSEHRANILIALMSFGCSAYLTAAAF